MASCMNCIHDKACDEWAVISGIPFVNADLCENFKNKADFVEVVRCPDCTYCENMKCTNLRDNTGQPLDVAIFDYCSQGIRK